MNSLRTLFSLVLYVSLTAFTVADDLKLSDLQIETEIARLAGSSASLVFAEGALWLSQSGKALVRVDARDNSTREIALPEASNRQREISAGEGAIWVPDVGNGIVFKVDPAEGQVIGRFPVGMLSTQATIAAGADAVWVVTDQKLETVLARLNATTGEQEALIELPAAGSGVLFAYDRVWVSSPPANAVYEIDPTTNTVSATIQVGESPKFMAAGGDAIWVLNAGEGTVSRVETSTGEVSAEIDIGFASTTGEIAFGGGYAWTSVPYKAVLIAIDPADNSTTRYIGRNTLGYVDYGAGSVWVWGRSILRIIPPID